MASTLTTHLPFFFLLVSVLFFSPQIQARESKFFNLFSHFRIKNNLYQIQPHAVVHKKAIEAKALAPEPADAQGSDQSILAPSSEPSFFANNGDSYGLYGVDDSKESFSPPTKETSTTTTSQNEVFKEDRLTGKSFKTGYPNTNVYSNNYSSSPSRNFNNQGNRNSYNNGGYSNGYSDSYYNNNYYYHGNSYEGKREEGLSDTKNEGYYDKSKHPDEFNPMEEYERQQRSQGYAP